MPIAFYCNQDWESSFFSLWFDVGLCSSNRTLFEIETNSKIWVKTSMLARLGLKENTCDLCSFKK